MPHPSRSVLRALLWAVPAAFLAWTGLAKLIWPQGTPPRALADLLEIAPWSTWLRGMGALEVGVAALLTLPRTRLAGGYAAFVLVAALTGLVALNADDTRFVSDCGCMGGLRPSGGTVSEADMLLVRNAALLFVLAFGVFLAQEGLGAGAAAARAGVVAGGILLAALFAAERVKASDAREALDVAQRGRSLAAWVGWKPTDLPVRDERGERSRLHAHLKPFDRLLVLSTTCAECAASGPGVQALAATLKAGPEGAGRVLLLVVEEGGPAAADWLPGHGFGGLPYLGLDSARDARLLGLESVPGWIVLDREVRVAQHEEHGGLPSLLEALESAGPAAAGLAEALWQQVASATVGLGATPGRPARDDRGWSADLEEGPGAGGRLYIRSGGKQRARALELAVALGSDGHLLGLVPLAAGSHVAWLSSDLSRDLAGFRGLTVPEAMARALARRQAGTLDAGTWRSVYLVLETLPGARGRAPQPAR